MNRIRKILVLLAGAIFFSLFWQSSHAETENLESLARARAYHKNPGFTNPWLADENSVGFFRFLKWLFSANLSKEEKKTVLFFQPSSQI